MPGRTKMCLDQLKLSIDYQMVMSSIRVEWSRPWLFVERIRERFYKNRWCQLVINCQLSVTNRFENCIASQRNDYDDTRGCYGNRWFPLMTAPYDDRPG